MHENPTCYRKYLLRLAQGFCTQSMKRPSAPVRVGNRTFSRSRSLDVDHVAILLLTKILVLLKNVCVVIQAAVQRILE